MDIPDKVHFDHAFALVKRHFHHDTDDLDYTVTVYFRPRSQPPVYLFYTDVPTGFKYDEDYTLIKSTHDYIKQLDYKNLSTIEVCSRVILPNNLECVVFLSGQRDVTVFYNSCEEEANFSEDMIDNVINLTVSYRSIYANNVFSEARKIQQFYEENKNKKKRRRNNTKALKQSFK